MTRPAAAPLRPARKTSQIAIDAELHALLKAKAVKEGRVLGAMCESKLWELVQPELIKL